MDLIRIGKSSSQCVLLFRSDVGDCSFWWLLWSAPIPPVSLTPFLGCGDPDPLSLSMVIPSITRRWTSAGLMLAQRRRRWTNIKPSLVQRVVFAVFHWDCYQELFRFLLQYNNVSVYSHQPEKHSTLPLGDHYLYRSIWLSRVCLIQFTL